MKNSAFARLVKWGSLHARSSRRGHSGGGGGSGGFCKEKVPKNSAGKKDGFRRVKAFGMVKELNKTAKIFGAFSKMRHFTLRNEPFCSSK